MNTYVDIELPFLARHLTSTWFAACGGVRQDL
jgi:hypothetical protein